MYRVLVRKRLYPLQHTDLLWHNRYPFFPLRFPAVREEKYVVIVCVYVAYVYKFDMNM